MLPLAQGGPVDAGGPLLRAVGFHAVNGSPVEIGPVQRRLPRRVLYSGGSDKPDDKQQGDKTESTWSRGQAWLVYGYTMLYRYTGYEINLERAEVAFDYYMSAMRLQTENNIPYSDFDAPVDETHPLERAGTRSFRSRSCPPLRPQCLWRVRAYPAMGGCDHWLE